ncbi:MAG: PstA family ABC transporter permease, partial [Paracoccaceae bacterium]
MTDIVKNDVPSFAKGQAHLRGRHAAETRFQWTGRVAIAMSLAFLVFMIGSIFWQGKGALSTTQIALTVNLDADAVDPADIGAASYGKIVKVALREKFPEAKKRKDKKLIYGLVSSDAGYQVERAIEADPSILGGPHTLWVSASDEVDLFMKGQIKTDAPEKERLLNDKELGWLNGLVEEGAIQRVFNSGFFTNGASREPELAGILSALVGSILSLSVCFLLSFPIGIMAAVYLEEFAPKNKFSDLIEININNLAAVPSIVFGLLGLSIFLGTFGLPRSSPLVGGMVLALMTLPTIIIASRASLRAVPPSIREAALGMGASPVQSTFHHVAPL